MPDRIIRHALRRTDDPSGPLLRLVEEDVPLPPPPNSIVIKVHAISLNYRDADICMALIPGEVLHVGENVRGWKVGDRVLPILDQKSITGREQDRSWLAADVDGVLADYLVMDESLVVRTPAHLTYGQASVLACAGVTAWSTLKGLDMGGSTLIQGTGGRDSELFEDDKLEKVRQMYETSTLNSTLQMINYAKNQSWHEEVLQVNGGIGVDLVLENGGTGSLVRRMKCTKRGGTVNEVGYLGKQNPEDLREMLSLLIDRKVNLRGINVGSKHDFEDLNAAVAATAMRFYDTIDRKFSFWDAEAAIEHVWQAKQVGKIVLHVQHGSGQ